MSSCKMFGLFGLFGAGRNGTRFRGGKASTLRVGSIISMEVLIFTAPHLSNFYKYCLSIKGAGRRHQLSASCDLWRPVFPAVRASSLRLHAARLSVACVASPPNRSVDPMTWPVGIPPQASIAQETRGHDVRRRRRGGAGVLVRGLRRGGLEGSRQAGRVEEVAVVRVRMHGYSDRIGSS